MDKLLCNASCDDLADRLNRDCFCTTLDRVQLHNILQADALNQDVLATHPQLFSAIKGSETLKVFFNVSDPLIS